MSDTYSDQPQDANRKRDERRAFLILAVLLAPALAVAIVGGWGFAVWMSQMVFGPPTG